MNSVIKLQSDNAWLNGREAWSQSNARGEVIVPYINVWEAFGPFPECGSVVGRLSHGTRVSVLEGRTQIETGRAYYKIAARELVGWVLESFIAWRWSCFTFLGTLHPSDACQTLETKGAFGGMELVVGRDGFAIVTEGDPGTFDSIHTAVSRYANSIASAQSIFSHVPLRVELTNWVEIPAEFTEAQRTVGFLHISEQQSQSITNQQIETAQSLVPLMAAIPYLDLALSDYMQALSVPEHALIFLARAIETIENHFEQTTQQHKGVGKQRIMTERLSLTKDYVDYVTKRANTSHCRHAAKDATRADLPPQELTECIKRTGKIICTLMDRPVQTCGRM